jgi:hypothetical protein
VFSYLLCWNSDTALIFLNGNELAMEILKSMKTVKSRPSLA